MGCWKADEMSRSVKSKTIRQDCHLLVRAEQNHLKTLVFLVHLFKLNRHKLDFMKEDELFFFFSDLRRLWSKIGDYFLLSQKLFGISWLVIQSYFLFQRHLALTVSKNQPTLRWVSS